MTFLTILGLMKILCSFKLVPGEKAGKGGILELSKLELLEKFLANNFALPVVEKTSLVS